MSRAAEHYGRLADQAESMRRHEKLKQLALGCLACALLIVLFAAVIA